MDKVAYGVTLPPYRNIHDERITLSKWGCLSYYALTILTSLLCFDFFKLGMSLEDDLRVGGRGGAGIICLNKEFGLSGFIPLSHLYFTSKACSKKAFVPSWNIGTHRIL